MTHQKKPARVSKDELRMLVQDIGYKEAAARTGVGYDALRKMGSRGKWFNPTSVLVTVQKPADVQQQILEERKNNSKLHLSQYVTEASHLAAEHDDKLAITAEAKDLASIRSSLWPEKEQPGSGVLGGLKVYSKQTVIAVQTREDAREAASELPVVSE